MTEIKDVNSWAFKEAVGLLKKLNNKIPEKGYVLFETGYGPSGLPHIGTFGEVVRTSMVRKAFSYISDIPTKMFCVSDDMDGLRKIPSNIPNKDAYTIHLDKPLTDIPDPFGESSSYGHYMNNKLKEFLDRFGFEYEFISATECYKSGKYNDYLVKVLEKYDEILDVMLPTLGEERRKSYSPFLPVCKETGRVLQVKVIDRDLEKREITYINSENQEVVISVLNGNCKLQWKPDFAMRWAAFDVDYEIYGKDIQANAKLYDKICRILGKPQPLQMSYELFLDENGEKISKSKGNGLTIEDWLKYGGQESLKLFMYKSPKKAKKLHHTVIPKVFDEYLSHLKDYNSNTEENKKLSNPVFYIDDGNSHNLDLGKISFTLLLNLVSACNTDDKKILMKYLDKEESGFNEDTKIYIEEMIGLAIKYYDDFIKSNKKYKIPNEQEKKLLQDLYDALGNVSEDADAIQNEVYRIGRDHYENLREWFQVLYEILLGTKDGPRLGTFINLYGIKKTQELINEKIS
ncbi:MAG: lysyl-tRNA synthetase class 1 [Candidatus Midichloriaceae bacterium]|jgi:lysyl-tRNA synthetase class 1